MLRLKGLFLGFGIVVSLYAGSASALGPAGHSPLAGTAYRSLAIPAAAMTERQKCKALNRCRYHYTVCYNKLEAKHRLDDKDEVCVKPYQKCINANFSGTEFLFTRWFNPNYIDCSQYPG